MMPGGAWLLAALVVAGPELPDLDSGERQRETILAAQKAAAAGRSHAAIRLYSAALVEDPNDREALQARARVYYATYGEQGCPVDAITDMARVATLSEASDEFEVRTTLGNWMNRCDSAFARERVTNAERAVTLVDANSPLAAPHHLQAAIALAHLAEGGGLDARELAERGLESLRSHRRGSHDSQRQRKPGVVELETASRLHRVLGQIEAARAVDQQIIAVHTEDAAAGRARSRLEDARLELEIREHPPMFHPSAQARAAVARGIALLEKGDRRRALTEFSAAVRDFPSFALAHKWLGSLQAASPSTLDDAIVSYKRAGLLDPTDHEPHVALGLVYLHAFPGQRAAARKHLQRAFELRPDMFELHLHLAEAMRGSDDVAAREHLLAFIAAAPKGHEGLARARRWMGHIDARVTPTDVPPLLPAHVGGGAPAIDESLHRLIVRAYVLGTQQGRWRDALAELSAVAASYRDEPALHAAMGTAARGSGQVDQAIEHWLRALELDPCLVDVHERLAIEHGDPATKARHLEAAAKLGSKTARLRMAEYAWDNWRPWTARQHVERYLALSAPYDLGRNRALQLEASIARFTTIVMATSIMALLAGSFWMGWFWWRRRSSLTLRELVERDPSTHPEFARIIGLIRHEILKHKTAFLDDVADALESNDVRADQRASLLAERLFAVDGAHAQFLGYIEQLRSSAARRGFRLRLERGDPVFSSMLASFNALAKRAALLAQTPKMSKLRRRRLVQVLRKAAAVLGAPGFRKLGSLMQGLCVSRLDADFVREIYARVGREPAFARSELPPLELAGELAGDDVRIFRDDLSDILANVLRNAMAASEATVPQPWRLKVELQRELDPVTGHESLALRICDRSPRRLTHADIESAELGRGLGLTVALLNRYDASMSVEDEPEPGQGWTKAVVLRFFCEAAADETD